MKAPRLTLRRRTLPSLLLLAMVACQDQRAPVPRIIADWRTRRLTTLTRTRVDGELFSESLDRALPDAIARTRARTSLYGR